MFKKENAVVSSANELVLTTKEEPTCSKGDASYDIDGSAGIFLCGVTCGYISTPLVVSTAELTFGFYEIRAKMAKASLLSSFFLQSTSGGGEISIVDAVPASTKNGLKVSNSYHCFNPADGTTTKSSEMKIAKLDPSDGFHTYGVERATDGAVKFYVDGALVRSLTPTDASCLQEPMQVIFSMVTANEEGVPTEFNAYTSHIEYFRHWTHSSTPTGTDMLSCIACADGTYMAETLHVNKACNAYDACPAGAVRNAAKKTKGECEPCKAGTFKTAGLEGSWDDLCSVHKECGNGEWTDPLAAVDSVTDRVCTAHDVCDITSTTPTYQSIAGTPTANAVCLALDVCNTETEYEAVPPASNANRGCAAISPACEVGTSFEVSAPTLFADRACSNVDICVQNTDSTDTTAYPGFYMASAPTATANTVCTALQTCDYEDFEIVDAPVDISTFVVAVYANNDRTCVGRVPCVDTFETTIKDAYTTACVAVETQTYLIEYPTTTCAVLFARHLTSNGDWETYLADDRKGKTGYTAGDWANVGTSKDVKVKGTAATYMGEMESFANDNGTGCKVSVPIFFVDRERRARRKSASGAFVTRTRRSVPEANPPQVYEIGSKPCSRDAGADAGALCCEAGYGSDSGTCVACRALSVHPNGATIHPTYTDGDTVASANGGCLPQPRCDFTSEFYRNPTPPTTAEATNNCQAMQKCSTRGKLSVASVEGYDRRCSNTDLVLCDSTTEYWSNAGDAAFANGFEWSVNPTCVTCKTCSNGEWWANNDATVGIPAMQHQARHARRRRSSSSLVVQQLLIEDRVCKSRSCDSNQYATNYVTAAAEGINSKLSYNCQTWGNCEANNPIGYASVTGTLSNDAVCTSLRTCTASTQFQTVAPTRTSNRYCKDLTVCDGTVYQENDAPTSTADRSCALVVTTPFIETASIAPTSSPSPATVPIIGCDGVENSGQIDDDCGVCNGDGSSCSVSSVILKTGLSGGSIAGLVVGIIAFVGSIAASVVVVYGFRGPSSAAKVAVQPIQPVQSVPVQQGAATTAGVTVHVVPDTVVHPGTGAAGVARSSSNKFVSPGGPRQRTSSVTP